MRRGTAQPLLLGIMLATGFLAVWALGWAWLAEACSSVLRGPQTYERPVFLPGGKILIEHWTGDGTYTQREYRDLDGNPMSPALQESELRVAQLGVTIPPRAAHFPGSWEDSLAGFSDGRMPAGFWYFILEGSKDPHGYFVGYDSETKTLLGYLGTRGLRQDTLPPEEHFRFQGGLEPRVNSGLVSLQSLTPTPYPGSYLAAPSLRGTLSFSDVFILGSDHGLYHVNLDKRTAEMIFREHGLRSAGVFGAGYSDTRRPIHLAVRTDNSVVTLDGQDRVLARFPIPEALLSQGFSFVEGDKDKGIFTWSSPSSAGVMKATHHIWWVSTQGTMEFREIELTGSAMETPPWLPALLCPSPLVLAGVGLTVMPLNLLDARAASSYPEAVAMVFLQLLPSLVATLVLAIVLALLCYRRQSLYGASRGQQIAWPLFVLLLGLPGWVAYRFGCSWPILERCPTCHVVVPRDRGECAHCRVTFPAPERKGTEVFA